MSKCNFYKILIYSIRYKAFIMISKYLDSYMWFRGIGCTHLEATNFANKELSQD